MITRDALKKFGTDEKTSRTVESGVSSFDIEGYLAELGLRVIQRKPWSSIPGGYIYEIHQCPFNPNHVHGSAAFTVVDGRPGFRCQHEGCCGKTIQDVFERYPPSSLVPSRGENCSAQDASNKETQSEVLIGVASDADLFHTPEKEPFACIRVGSHQEIWPVKSLGFRQWLVRAYYLIRGKPPAVQALQDVLSLLEARARFDFPEIPVYGRVAPYGGSIFVDLCNDNWEAVEITASGWRVVQSSPVRFRRTRGMQALPVPSRCGSISMLRRLINVGDDRNWTLAVSWLVAALRPRGPYPILILQGEQGSAKSTTARLLRKLIDPVSAPLRSLPREERDLLIAANNSRVVAYDNLSGIPHTLSDALCRLATGGGFSTRELYSNTDEVILELTRPIILNGIDQLAERPDLADRAIILQLPRISEEERRDEEQLYTEFERDHPAILGALFDAVAWAIGHLNKVELPRKPRMADFAMWATAAEGGLGFISGDFMNAFGENRAEAISETLESDTVGQAILAFRNESSEDWTGTAGDLLKQLESVVEERIRVSSIWPKTPRALSGRLRRLATFLREMGIEIVFHSKKGTGGQRLITITRKSADFTAPTATTVEAGTQDSGNEAREGK